MTIGIFGGSFNPIHKGHISIARQVLEKTFLDEVWFVVSPHNPFKQHHDLMDDSLRLEMVRQALEDEKGMKCSDCEYHLPQPSYTWNTLQALTKDYPNDTFTLLIGADNWASFTHWRNSNAILVHHDVLIYPRRGYDINPQTLPHGVTYLDFPLLDVSATDLRCYLSEGKDVSNWIPKQALALLKKKI